jgi:hypothetical protein
MFSPQFGLADDLGGRIEKGFAMGMAVAYLAAFCFAAKRSAQSCLFFFRHVNS